MTGRTAAQEWRTGWTLVLASSVGFAFFSVLLASVGLFMQPLEEEFGWSRTLLSSGPSVATIMTALLGPFFGMLVDRFGTRRLVLPGLVLTIGSISLFSLANGSEIQWLAFWFVFGVVSVSIKSTPWTTAIVGVFKQSRGLALAWTLGGTAVAQATVPPLGNYLISEFGWRAAFVWLALGWGGVTLVLCVLFFYDMHDKADRHAGKSEDTAPLALSGLTIGEAARDSAIRRIAVSNFVVMFLTTGLAVHLFPILTEAGVRRSTAAWLMGLSGLAGIVGKLITGWLLDRFRPNLIGGLTLGAATIAFVLLMKWAHVPALVIVALMVNGYAAGTKTQITGFVTAGYAGMKNFGAIYGLMSSLMALASGLGPLMAGLFYDYGGGYGPFLLFGAIGCALGGALMMTLPPYPKFEEPQPSGTETAVTS